MRSRLGALGCGLLLSLLGCVQGEPHDPLLPIDRDEHPLAGLYTPGSTLGYESAASARDAGAGGLSAEEQRRIEDGIAAAQMMDRCAPLGGEPGTPGTLTIRFETGSYGGFYEPENCGAVWIQDAQGHYVATPDVWAKLRLRNLFLWQAHRCEDDVPDAISSATLETHQKHEVSWDGLDLTGAVAPDGPYVLNIEVTEDELNYGRRTEVPFEKGTAPQSLTPADTQTVRGLAIEWQPTAEAEP